MHQAAPIRVAVIESDAALSKTLDQAAQQLFCAPEAKQVHFFSYFVDANGKVSEARVIVERNLDYQA